MVLVLQQVNKKIFLKKEDKNLDFTKISVQSAKH